jgi:hypothetical protein
MRLRSPYLHPIVVSCLLVILPGLWSRADMRSSSDPSPNTAHVTTALAKSMLTSRAFVSPQGAATPGGAAAIKGALTLSIDGQLTPDRISDQVAYRHFISVTAVRSGASTNEIHRRDAILKEVGLSDGDRRVYLTATITVRDALQDIEQNMEAVHQDIAAVDALKQQRGSVLDNAAKRILSSLSVDGVARMRMHINDRVKKRIRIYSQVQ